MKRNFRGGSGKGSNQSKGSDSKDNQNNKDKRATIKNARSLRDVLGLGEKKPSGQPERGYPKSGSPQHRRDETVGEDRRRAQNRKPERSSESSPPASKGPLSKKLTYIMSFQPPEEKATQQKTAAPSQKSSAPQSKPTPPSQKSSAPTSAKPVTPAQRASSPSQASKPVSEKSKSRFTPSSSRKERREGKSSSVATPTSSSSSVSHPPSGKEDYRWPRERVAKTEERRGKSLASNRVTGIVKRHPDGYGFLIPDVPNHPDVYISRHNLDGIMTNDRVEVAVQQKGKGRDGEKGDRLFGEVVRVVSRANGRIVGQFLPVDLKYGVILDEGRGWGADLRIATKDSMGAKEGDLVAVEITQYPRDDREFTGRVISLLGNLDEPLNDVKRIIYSQGIPAEFSSQAVADARRFGGKVTEGEIREREDIRHLPLITIDSKTARDFDDAVWVEQTPNGFHLVVGIADVSHYVKPGTKLDQEAYERGTSTYFPNFVVPMLPEELSNELCSLKPRVPRLCFACDIELDFTGEIIDYRFFEAVMESKARVTYGEAQEVIDGNCPHALQHIKDNILRSADLAKILMNKRFREGSLDLEIPETQVVVDSTGDTVDIIKSERLFAHRLIEELMLITNICTARFLAGLGIPGIYRVHEEPKEENIRALQRYLWNLGGNRSVMGDDLQKKLTKALQAVEGQPGAQILNILTLRTMNQAKYSEQNIGHFGLGFSHYSHFTSPIRRYPDLIAHRLIKSHLYPKYRNMQMLEEELASASVHLSACEQRSVKAERQVISIKKARFMRRFEGQEFEGLISSVAKFGVFVLLRQYDVDGLVKIEELGNDRFLFDEENLRLIGSRTGKRFCIGDRVRVVVRSADPMQGRIDFVLAEGESAKSSDDDEFDFDGEDGLNEKPREQKRGTRKAGKKDRFDVQERRKISNDRGRVRKERVSKRRRKT